jgi:hypothetical protein
MQFNMWHDMAIIILCSWSPSPKHLHDLHRHRRPTWISIMASWSSHRLLLLLLPLTHSGKVKQLHSVGIAYNKETTIRLLPVADNLQNMIISYNNVYHIMSWPYHITSIPCKNKLDVLYFVVASFTWLLRVCKNRSYLRQTTTWCSDCFLMF